MRLLPALLITLALLFSASGAVGQSANLYTEPQQGTPSPSAGRNSQYAMSVFNVGPDPAVNTRVVYTLPPEATFVSVTPSSSQITCTTPPVGSGGQVSCVVGTLQLNGAAWFSIVIFFPMSVPDQTVTQSVFEATSDTPDPNPSNNAAPYTLTVYNRETDFAVVNSGPSTAAAGTDVSYTVEVVNNGPNPIIGGIQLVDRLAGSATAFTATQISGPTFTCEAFGVSSYLCERPTLAAGERSVFRFVASRSPATTGSVSNSAEVFSPTEDLDRTNNVAIVTTRIDRVTDLTVTKTGPPSVLLNGDVTYEITVRNFGPSQAQMIALSDPLPANVSFVSVSSDRPATCTSPAVGATGTVRCVAATLDPQTSIRYTLVGRATGAPTITNTATVSGAGTDPNSANNSATATTTVSALAIPTLGTAALLFLAAAFAALALMAVSQA